MQCSHLGRNVIATGSCACYTELVQFAMLALALIKCLKGAIFLQGSESGYGAGHPAQAGLWSHYHV